METNNNKPKGTSNKPQLDKATQPTNPQNHNRTTTPKKKKKIQNKIQPTLNSK